MNFGAAASLGSIHVCGIRASARWHPKNVQMSKRICDTNRRTACCSAVAAALVLLHKRPHRQKSISKRASVTNVLPKQTMVEPDTKVALPVACTLCILWRTCMPDANPARQRPALTQLYRTLLVPDTIWYGTSLPDPVQMHSPVEVASAGHVRQGVRSTSAVTRSTGDDRSRTLVVMTVRWSRGQTVIW